MSSKCISETGMLDQFEKSVQENLFQNILPFWLNYSIDKENGGFFGRISNDLQCDKNAPKSLILISRILWTFSALYQFEPNDQYLEIANRAYNYLKDHLIDDQYGGAYWLVDTNGLVIDNMKKMYGQAFLIYSLSEYYSVVGETSILERAIDTFHLIENHNYDKEFGGYFEVSNRDWSIAEDMRLSAVDMNEKKSMNTHLHLVEAYTNLYRNWKNDHVRDQLRKLIDNFIDYIIDPETYHFKLFMDEKWQPKSEGVSYGHDIEGSWLLCEAVQVLNDDNYYQKVNNISVKMTDTVIREALSNEGAVFLEKDGVGKILKDIIYWWPQSEAVVGFLNTFQLRGDLKYLNLANRAWQYIEKYLVDRQNGEWFYEVSSTGQPNPNRLKVSEWKGPYHNTRACLEILKRIEAIRQKA